ncbi:MAG: S4 domain-containing protein YaaA [bacterium]
MEKVKINTEFITLGQLLKITTIASSGGMAKMLLQELVIYVDNELENRRGKKLYPGTIIEIKEHGKFQIEK